MSEIGVLNVKMKVYFGKGMFGALQLLVGLKGLKG